MQVNPLTKKKGWTSPKILRLTCKMRRVRSVVEVDPSKQHLQSKTSCFHPRSFLPTFAHSIQCIAMGYMNHFFRQILSSQNAYLLLYQGPIFLLPTFISQKFNQNNHFWGNPSQDFNTGQSVTNHPMFRSSDLYNTFWQ